MFSSNWLGVFAYSIFCISLRDLFWLSWLRPLFAVLNHLCQACILWKSQMHTDTSGKDFLMAKEKSTTKYFGFQNSFHVCKSSRASSMLPESSIWHKNFAATVYPVLPCTHTKNTGIAYLVVLYVASMRTNSSQYRSKIFPCHSSDVQIKTSLIYSR